MAEFTPELLAARKKLLDDFAFYAKHCVRIRTKEATIVPLVLNKVQQRFIAECEDQLRRTGRIRKVVLKARQQGLSTVISAWQYWWLSQHKAQKGLVMAHDAESTTTLFDMYKRIHENAPEIVRPSTKYSSRNELVFDKLDTGVRVATAGGRGVARGETLTVAHLSEVAFWPVAFANNNFNSLVQAIPETNGTAIFLESTAQGMTGKFREVFVGAEDGSNGYETFFSAWFESDEYRIKPDEGFTRTPEEEQLVASFGLDNEQLQWRRRKIATNGMDLFKQEYPATPEEAFISTGRPVFNPDFIQQRIRECHPPITTMTVEFAKQTDKVGTLKEHPRGELKVYHERDDKETYVIGADVGMGVRGKVMGRKDGDPSVAQVLDSQMRQVAVWRGLIHPDEFAKVLVSLGYYYNSALLAPERNNHGLVTCINIRDAEYPFIYTDVAEGTLEPDKDTIRLGFYTSEATKPLIIDKLRACDRDRELEINDKKTLQEMLGYVVTESGKMQAEDGANDDTVMALAIATYAHEGKWTPVAVTDDFYTTAI